MSIELKPMKLQPAQEPVKRSRKWAKEAHAWIDRIEVEGFCISEWWSADDKTNPITRPDIEWRIKPEPKPDVVRFYTAQPYGHLTRVTEKDRNANLKLTWDGETGNLKAAEVLK